MSNAKKDKIPSKDDLLKLASKSVAEMEKSIQYLAKVRDGRLITETIDGVKKIIEFDNKDRIQAALRSMDIGKFFFQIAYDDASEKDSKLGTGTKDEPRKTAPVFALKKPNSK